MAPIRVEDELPSAAVDFLRHCYRFVNEEWGHADRQDLPDQGFESYFRASLINRLSGWESSQEREMGLGNQLPTASSVLHEIDIVANHSDVTAIMELKNRQGSPSKNDVIILFAKLLDYLTLNPHLLLKELCPIFMSTSPFEQNGLVACLGLGIHAVGPGIRPLPVLIDNAKRIDVELSRGVQVSEETLERVQEFCAEINRVSLSLGDSWFSSRFGYLSEDTIMMKAVTGYDTSANCHSIYRLNAECNYLLSVLREAKQ